MNGYLNSEVLIEKVNIILFRLRRKNHLRDLFSCSIRKGKETFIQTFILDLRLDTHEGDHEGITVPMDLYDKACIHDAQEGVEVRFYL